MSATFFDARSADGPRLAAYIEQVRAPNLPSNVRRAINDWTDRSVHPSYYDADRVLIAVGLHPSVVPPSLWRLAPPSGGKRERCAVCGKPLDPKRRASRNRCCSMECEVKRRKRAAARPRETKKCGWCGKTFERGKRESKTTWDVHRFCGEDCRRAARKAHGGWNKRRAVAA